MKVTEEIAKHLREVYNGNNWTDVSMRDALKGISWEQATRKVDSLNTIAMLVFHMNYYVRVAIKVLEGTMPDAHDKNSFDLSPIQNETDWKQLVDTAYADAERLASLIEQLDDIILFETFWKEKYGNYYRNLTGVIEHCYYHMGQVVVLGKFLSLTAKTEGR